MGGVYMNDKKNNLHSIKSPLGSVKVKTNISNITKWLKNSFKYKSHK